MDKNYGQLYYKFLSKGFCKDFYKEAKESSPIISIEHQEVYSFIPARYEYENTRGICKQLAIFTAKMFLESSSLYEYAIYFSGLMKKLSVNTVLTIEAIKLHNDINCIKGYAPSSRFIRGEDVVTEIMQHSLQLEAREKSSILIVMGGHTFNVLMWNSEDKIFFSYFDPHFGDLFSQTATKSEVAAALSGKAMFVHPRSILNYNNILLGQTSIKLDSLIDTNPSFVFLTSLTKFNNIWDNREIVLSENVKIEDIALYLAQTPEMLSNIVLASDFKSFFSFIDTHGSLIKSKMSVPKKCYEHIMGCSNYLSTILDPIYKKYTSIENSIDISFANYAPSKTELFSFKKPAKLCFKKEDSCGYRSKEHEAFFKILFDDKDTLYPGISKCLNAKNKFLQKKIAQEVCANFTHVSETDFSKAHKAFYNRLDKYYATEETCVDSTKVNEWFPTGTTSHAFDEL